MSFSRNSNLLLYLVGIIVLLSRLPFLGQGYGVEEDSWGIAVALHNTAVTGVHEASRLPGHPVHELFMAVLWEMGARFWTFNFLSASASAIGVIFFGLILKKLGFRHFLLASIAFAFVPVIYIASTYTIDYSWTIAFTLASYYALITKRYWLCGILLGLAIGCRLTSAAMLLPFAIQLWDRSDTRRWFTRMVQIGSAAGVIGIICYIPVMIVYGMEFLTYSDQFPYPPFTKIFYKGTIGVFGLIGFTAIIGFPVLAALRNRGQKNPAYKRPLNQNYSLAWLSAVVIYIIAYFGLPQKSAYLIPLVPFVMLLVTLLLNSTQFRWFATCMILSPFFFSINLTDPFRGSTHSPLAFTTTVSGQEVFLDPLTGPIFSDYSKRKLKMAFTQKVREQALQLEGKAVIISGWWYNMILTELYDLPGNPDVTYTFYSDEAELKKYAEQGYNIFYLPEQDRYNDLNFKMEITNKMAKPFIPHP